MFKADDRIVLTDNESTYKTYYIDLKVNITYIVDKDSRNFPTDGYIRLKNHPYIYDSERFISLLEYRKRKLWKLKEKISSDRVTG